MQHKNLVPLLFATLLLAVGAGLVFFSTSALRTDRLLDEQSLVTEGRVLSSSKTVRSKSQTLILEVEYVPANHPAIRKNFDVDGSTYTASVDSGKTSVTYRPDTPEISRVVRFDSLPYQILLWLGGFIILGGLTCVWIFLKSRTMQQK